MIAMNRNFAMLVAGLLALSADAVAGTSPALQALDHLQQQVAASLASGQADPMAVAIGRYLVEAGPSFEVSRDDNDSDDAGVLPSERPDGVSEDEWQALKRTDIDVADTEDGRASVRLLDLDEDGRRDLIVDRYSGGTGLFSFVSVYRRTGDRFEPAVAGASSADSWSGELYSINGRGSDQQGTWVKIDGRVYLAYRQGEYGSDDLVLMRAFEPRARRLPAIHVEYRYRYGMPQEQTMGPSGHQHRITLAKDLYEAIQNMLREVSEQDGLADGPDSYGTCAASEIGADEAQDSSWPWFGDGSYTSDIVADFPVRDGRGCHAARLESYRSSYLEGDSVSAQLQLMDRPGAEEQSFDVYSTREPVKVSRAAVDLPDA